MEPLVPRAKPNLEHEQNCITTVYNYFFFFNVTAFRWALFLLYNAFLWQFIYGNTCYYFSLHLSIDGVDHLIDFESNHLHSASVMNPISSPDLHTSPRGLETRYHTSSFPGPPAGLSSSSCCRSHLLLSLLFLSTPFRGLTFFSRGQNKQIKEREWPGCDPPTLGQF